MKKLVVTFLNFALKRLHHHPTHNFLITTISTKSLGRREVQDVMYRHKRSEIGKTPVSSFTIFERAGGMTWSFCFVKTLFYHKLWNESEKTWSYTLLVRWINLQMTMTQHEDCCHIMENKKDNKKIINLIRKKYKL